MKVGHIFKPFISQGDDKSWEVIEVLDSSLGIYTIRRLFDTSCKSEQLYVG